MRSNLQAWYDAEVDGFSQYGADNTLGQNDLAAKNKHRGAMGVLMDQLDELDERLEH
jgi:hypothetical protein